MNTTLTIVFILVIWGVLYIATRYFINYITTRKRWQRFKDAIVQEMPSDQDGHF
jgi:hypothetical protein